ncbi:MAG: hypothetical protein ABIQ51_15085 [Mesorhizobium sp.]
MTLVLPWCLAGIFAHPRRRQHADIQTKFLVYLPGLHATWRMVMPDLPQQPAKVGVLVQGGRGAETALTQNATRSSSFTPPFVLPDISPTRGEIGSFASGTSSSMLKICEGDRDI